MKESKKNFIINKINPNEYSSFEKFEQKLKESIFGVLYVLLKDDHSSLILHFVLTIIEFLQFMIFPFDKSVRTSWGNSSIVKSIYDALNYINFVHYLQGASTSLYLIVFYLCLLLVILMIINIVYVSYSFSRNFFTVTWPLYVLRHVAKAIVTIFFMPLQEIFISIFFCQTDATTKKTVNSFSTSIECWTGLHFLHLFCSIAVSIIFIMISLIVALTYFECNDSGENHGAKVNSRADVIMLISKIISILCFTFLGYKEYEWFLICVILFLSIIQFSKFYFEKPYFNKTLQILMEIVNGIYMWTNFVLLISKIFQSYNFTGGIYVWATGIPLVILFLVFNSSDIISMLSKNINKFQKGEEIEKQMRYFIRLFNKKGKHRESEILLKGFIRNHEDNCGMNDCPLKVVKKLLDSYSGNLDIFSKNHNIQQNLLNFANRIYTIGLSKFPNCTSLRISYSLFLYHHLKQKMNALQEFSNAEKSNPPLDLQFIIFRYKKIINEDQDTVENLGEALDVVSGIAYDSHFRQCQTNIHKAAMLFLDFWGILNSQNTSPDLYKLNELGLKINETLKNVHTHWHHMQHYKAGDPKALKMYASFWIEILNNKEKGQEYLNSKETGEKRQVVMKDFDIGKDENLATNMNEGYALLVCSAEPDNFGTILKSTSNGCKLFGYTQNELWGKHLDNLFLDIYTGNISNYIRHLINDWEYEKSKKIDNFYGKTKSHHCILLNVQLIDPKKVINDKVHFLLLVWTDFNLVDLKQYKRSCHFIVSSNLTIYNYSSQAIELLYLLYGKIPGENFLHSLFPELCRDDSRDRVMDNSIKITDTVLNELLIDNTTKHDILIKSRANRNEIPNSYYIDQEFFKKSYNCEFSLKVIETNLSEKEDAVPNVGKKDESELNNQNYLKEVYYSVNIEYQLNENYMKKRYNQRSTLHDSSHGISTLKNDYKGENYLLRESIAPKMDTSLIRDGVNESLTVTGVEKRFNIKQIEGKTLKMEYNKVINEIRDKNDFNLTLMSYIKDIEKFKNLFKWYDEGDIQSNVNISNFSANKSTIQQQFKRDVQPKNSVNKSGNKIKKIDDSENQMVEGDYIPLGEGSKLGNKIEISVNNNLNSNNIVIIDKDNTENLINKIGKKNSKKNKSPKGENEEEYESEIDDDDSEEYDDDADSENSNQKDYESSNQESKYEEAIDIIHSPDNLDLVKLTKRLENLKDYSKNIEFCYFRESADRSTYPLTVQIIEVMKNVNLLHDSDGESRKEKNNEITSSFSTKKSNDVNNNKTPPSLNKLRVSSFLTLLIFLSYSIVEFTFNVNANTITNNNFQMIYYSYQAINEVTWASYLVRNLILTNNKDFVNFAGFDNKSVFITMNYDYLNTSYINLMNIASNITNSNLDILPQHYNIIKTQIVPLYFENSSLSTKTNYFTLPDAIKSIYVKILTIIQQDSSLITESNIDVMNVQFNVYNDFLINLQKSASYYTSVK